MAEVFDPFDSAAQGSSIVDPFDPGYEKPGIVVPSLKRLGGRLVQGTGQALADAGVENPLTDIGRGIVERNPSAIGGLADVVENPLTFVGETLTDTGGQVAASVAGKAAGTLAGRALGAKIGGALGAFGGPVAPATVPAGAVAGGLLGGKIGGYLGSSLPLLAQSYGGIRDSQIEAGQEDIPLAIGGAAASAAVERLGLEKAAGALVGQGARRLAPDASRLAEAGKSALRGALVETPTEIVQGDIERFAGFQPLSGPEAFESRIVEGLAGAVGGAGIGGAIGAITPREAPRDPTDPSKPAGPVVRAALAAPTLVPGTPDPAAAAEEQRIAAAADEAAVTRDAERMAEEERRSRYMDASNVEVGEMSLDEYAPGDKQERGSVKGIEVGRASAQDIAALADDDITLETDPRVPGIEVGEATAKDLDRAAKGEEITLDSFGEPKKGSTVVGSATTSELTTKERAAYEDTLARRAQDDADRKDAARKANEIRDRDGIPFKSYPGANAARKKLDNADDFEVKRLDKGQFVLARKANGEANPAAEVAAASDGRPGDNAPAGNADSSVDGNRPGTGDVRADAAGTGSGDAAAVPVATGTAEPAAALTETGDVRNTEGGVAAGAAAPAATGTPAADGAGTAAGAVPGSAATQPAGEPAGVADAPATIRRDDGTAFPTRLAANVARIKIPADQRGNYSVAEIAPNQFEVRRNDAQPADVQAPAATPVAQGQAAQASKDDRTLDERLDSFVDEKNALLDGRAKSGDNSAKGASELERALGAVSSGALDFESLKKALAWAKKNGRKDIADAIIERAKRAADSAASAKPGLSPSSPKYQAALAALAAGAEEAKRKADELEADNAATNTVKPPAVPEASAATPPADQADTTPAVDAAPASTGATAPIRERAKTEQPGMAKTLNLLADAIDARDTAALDRIIGNVLNKNARDEFTKATGVKLPKTQKGTRAAVEAWRKSADGGQNGPESKPNTDPESRWNQGDAKTRADMLTEAGREDLSKLDDFTGGTWDKLSPNIRATLRGKAGLAPEQAAKRPPTPQVPPPAAKAADKEIGTNADGEPIFEDDKGVRYVVKSGVKVSAPVEMVPTRGANGGVQYQTRPNNDSPRFQPAEKSAEQPPKQEPTATPKPSGATLVTDARLEEVKRRIAEKLKAARNGMAPSGIDPELLALGAELAVGYIERGVRKFAEFAKRVVGDLGDDIKPYLKMLYNAAQDYPGFDAEGMDESSAVRKMDIDAILAQADTESVETATAGGASDERSGVRGEGTAALGEVAAQEDGRAEGERDAGSGDSGGREAGAAAGAGPDAAGVPPARGGRGRPARADSAAPGDGRSDGAVGAKGTRKSRKRVPEPVAPESAPNLPAQNFRITPDLRLGTGGEVEKFNDNLAAIRALKQIESERRRATPEEQRLLARYVGWGGLASAFPAPVTGEYKDRWGERGASLKELLTPSEYAEARRSTRNAHYTSETVVSAMWKMAERLGFRGGLTLESSMGAGNFIGLMPEGVPAKVIGVEYDNLTSRIAGLLYPQATVLNSGFQYVPVADNAFALNIGNPPFGNESLRFQFKPELNGKSIHNQFFLAGIDAVRPGGLQVMVVSRYLLDAQDTDARKALATKAKLVAAIRLPDSAFKENARTEVVTDIIILQRHDKRTEDLMKLAFIENGTPAKKDTPADEVEGRRQRARMMTEAMETWVNTAAVADPLGGESMTVNAYFAKNPAQVLGVMDRSGSMKHGADITVTLPKEQLQAALDAAVARLPEGISKIDDEVLARTEERFELLSEALRIAVAKEEPGHVGFNADGKLARVVEREAPDGGMIYARQTITAESPWSDQLSLDAEGRWYRHEVATGEDGKPVKETNASGKATNRNVYRRTTFMREEDVPGSLRLGEAGFKRLSGIVNLRDLLKKQLVLETEDATPAMMEGNRKKLAAAYKEFVREYGPLNRRVNLNLAMTMPDGGLTAALEVQYQPERSKAQAEKSGLEAQAESAESAPILRERVVLKYEPATNAATAADALAITLAERGAVDIERIAQLRGVSPEAVADELQAGDKPLAFMDPETQQWQSADAYLSGQVKRKLRAAQAAGLQANVTALEAVQPEAWTAENVAVQIGSTTVPVEVYQDFAKHLFGGSAYVSHSALTNSFALQVSGAENAKAEQWGADNADGPYILSRLLNSQAPVVTYTDSDGNTRVDKEQTALASLKGREIVAEFGDWIFKDADRRQKLVDIYNEKFNTRVNRQFDGSHLSLPGKVPDAIISLRRHQKNAIWRGISSRFLLLDHVVGSGKTFTGIARAMERRRMGLARKPTIVVPNHLVEQWAADIYRLYPAAKVLAAGQKDFETKRRRRLFGKIATGDWDIVVIPHSSFGFIGIAPETEMRFLEKEMKDAQDAIKEAEEEAAEQGQDQGFRKPFGVKEAERLAEKIQARMDKLREGARDRLLTFEQLGIDDLTIDEAHEFKNLFYSSRLTGVRGMGNKTGSRKAADLYNKVRVLRENAGSVTFMTGTPVSNSVVELYTMMRYLAADELAEAGLTHFDAWRAEYVDALPAFEPTESGSLKEVTRLGRTWSNMRAMMDVYYQFSDAVSIDDIKKWYAEDNGGKEFPVPKVKGGDRQLIKMQATEAQAGELTEIISGFDGLEYITDPKERNIARLKLMDRARKVSLDIRAAKPGAVSEEKGGKLERIAAEAARIYKATAPIRGTQLIFLDRSVPKAKGDDAKIKDYDALMVARDKALREKDEAAYQQINDKLEAFDKNEIEALRSAQSGGWNAYQQIKDNLIASGIPANEIRFVQEANTDEQKAALFDAVRGGKVRILLGSTPRMGAGTNVQDRLVALHHADVTWKPSDIEQREGRIIRQGNLFADPRSPEFIPGFEVEINAYATERTVDAKMWDLNATKLRAINGLRKYDGAFSMDIEDEESASMAEMAALASGNPLLLERVKLESQINALELQERAHRRRVFGLMDSVDTAKRAIAENPRRIEAMKVAAADMKQRLGALEETAEKRRVNVEGKTYDKRFDALAAATEAIDAQKQGDEKARFALNIDGNRYTSKQAVEDAIERVMGDDAEFEATINGETYTTRLGAGRAIAEAANAKAQNLDGKTGALDLGEMLGLRLVGDLTISRNDAGIRGMDVELTLMDGEKTVLTGPAIKAIIGENGFKFTSAAVRNGLSTLLTEAAGRADSRSSDYLERQLERAQRDLPELEAKAKDTEFPKVGELKEKRQRLNEVVRELQGKATATEGDAIELDMTPEIARELRESTGRGGSAETSIFPNYRRPERPQADETGEFMFQLAPATQGMTRAKAQAAVDIITRAWANAPQIVVLDSMADPQAPKGARDAYQKRVAGGAKGSPRGFIMRDGTVYIVASQQDSVKSLLTTVLHESAGHYGLRGVFGIGLNDVLKQVVNMRKADISRKMAEYGFKPGDELRAAEEVLAEMAEKNPQLGFVKRAVAAIRAFIRSLGVPLKLTDADIIAQFIIPAREYVQEGGDRAPVEGAEPMAAALAKQTESAEFKRWFGGSKVVDAEGKPLVVYHHSPDTNAASIGRSGILAAETVDGNMPEVWVSDTPRFERGVTVYAIDARNIELEESFNDDVPDGERWFSIYRNVRPDEIKSAIGNRGTFDPNDARVDFSLADTAAQARQRIGDMMDSRKTFNWWHNTVGTQYHKAQIDKDYKRVFDRGQQYLHDVSRIAMGAADLAPDILPKLEKLSDTLKSGASPRDLKPVADAIFLGTLEDEKVYTDAELVSRFKLNPKQVRLYRQSRAAIDRSLDDIAITDMVKLARSDISETQAKRAAQAPSPAAALSYLSGLLEGKDKLIGQLQEKAGRIADLKAKGYAPLMRFGRYTVSQTDAKGEQLYFGMFEDEADARKMERELKESNPQAVTERGVMSQEAFKLFKGISPDTLDIFAQAAGVSDNAMFQEYLKLAINNRSALKRLIKRKGIAGYNTDLKRVLAQFITSNARVGSGNLHRGEMLKAANDIPREKGDVKDEAVKLLGFVQDPQEEASGLRNFLFFNFLGGSVASAAVNMTQPVTMTLPYLAQWGARRAAKEVAAAVKHGLHRPITEPALRAAMDRAIKEGVVEPHQIFELQGAAMQSETDWGKADKLREAARKASFAWGRLFSMAEAFNRRLSFAAAFQIGRTLDAAALKKVGVADAYDFAVKAVEETQGIYNRGNRPDWARGALGATIFTFKQFSIAYMEFLKRLPRRERVMALGVLVLAAGLNGLPGADDLDDLIDTLAQQLGFSWNTKKERDQLIERAIAPVLGAGGAEFARNGVSAFLPIDVQGRMGLQNLIPGTGIALKSQRDPAREIAEAIGPAAGLVKGYFEGAGQLLQGNARGAVEAAAPVAVQNALKAAAMAEVGYYRDQSGRKVIDTDAVDAAWKSIGFQPATVARESRAINTVRQDIELNKITESGIADLWAQGIFEKNPEKVERARAKLQDWNRRNPTSRIAIVPNQIRQRVKQMGMTREQRFLKTAPREMRQQIAQEIAQ